MSILGKLSGKKLIDQKIRMDILCERGNIHQTFPSDFSDEEKADIGAVRPYTMTSLERLVALSRSIDHLVSNRIAGDIVECGVWRGGSMMLVARKLARAKDTDRRLFLFDTFDGMSEPGSEDVNVVDNATAEQLMQSSDKMEGNNVWCYSPLEEVRANVAKGGYPAEKIHFIKGKVEDTLPEPSVGKIALLRLDTDWYESTRHELEHLFPLLVKGGVLILDDYGYWAGAKKAVDEYFTIHKQPLLLNRIDETGRIAIKQF